MARRRDISTRIVEAALRLAAQQPWETVSLGEVAAAAKVRLSELYGRFPSKIAIVRAFIRRIDEEVLATDFAFDAEDVPRDRLFDVLMRRYDALSAHKPAVLSMMAAYPPGSLTALALLPDLARSMGWMMEAAGIRADGAAGLLRTKALIAVWLATGRVWRDDDTPDMARTMAVLDRNLRRWERLTRRIPGPGPVRARAATAPGGESAARGRDDDPGAVEGRPGN